MGEGEQVGRREWERLMPEGMTGECSCISLLTARRPQIEALFLLWLVAHPANLALLFVGTCTDSEGGSWGQEVIPSSCSQCLGDNHHFNRK